MMLAFSRHLRPLALLFLGLAGCGGGLDSHPTGRDEFTIRADGDGGTFAAFEKEALDVCPQGFRRLDTVTSAAGGSLFASWRIQCRAMDEKAPAR